MTQQNPMNLGWMSLPPEIPGEPFASTDLERIERDGGIELPAEQFDQLVDGAHRMADPLIAQLRAERLRRRRSAGRGSSEWTQMYVADLLGVAPNSVCQWERGYHLPSVALLRAWAALFDLDLALLYVRKEAAA